MEFFSEGFDGEFGIPTVLGPCFILAVFSFEHL